VAEVKSTLARLIDLLKLKQITLLGTSLTGAGDAEQQSEVGISSLMDTWLLLRNLESYGERNRGLYVLKSRGMAHSNQVREFLLSDSGINLVDVYVGSGEVLAGSARLAQLERERVENLEYEQQIQAMRHQIERRRLAAEAQIAALRAQIESEDMELVRLNAGATARTQEMLRARTEMARSRMSDNGPA
jgi:circadian clock protein KaiC